MTVSTEAIRSELEMIRNRAEALADTLDQLRTFTSKDETTRIVVSACDGIVKKAVHALAVLEGPVPA